MQFVEDVLMGDGDVAVPLALDRGTDRAQHARDHGVSRRDLREGGVGEQGISRPHGVDDVVREAVEYVEGPHVLGAGLAVDEHATGSELEDEGLAL